jgi:hypothetical protein
MDVVVPIVYPDYLIHVDTPAVDIKIPDILPGVDLLPDRFKRPKTTQKVPQLGHAGVLFINGKSGLTKYYEYGRYDAQAKGIVRPVLVPDVVIKNGNPTHESLKKVMASLSLSSGQKGRISAAYIQLPDGSFSKMQQYAEDRKRQNTDPKRVPYDLLTHSCLHFMKSVAEEGGASLPEILVPTPKMYMLQVRVANPILDYEKGELTVPSLE